MKSERTVDRIDILLQNHLVPLALQRGHADVDVDLLLGEQALLDVGLDATQKEGTKHGVELLDDRVGRRLLLRRQLVGNFSLGRERGRLSLEPGVKVGHVGEDVGKEEAVRVEGK